MRVARTEPTLRDMLQQFRHLFDHLIYGDSEARSLTPRESIKTALDDTGEFQPLNRIESAAGPTAIDMPSIFTIKSVAVVHSPETSAVPLAEAVDDEPAGMVAADRNVRPTGAAGPVCRPWKNRKRP